MSSVIYERSQLFVERVAKSALFPPSLTTEYQNEEASCLGKKAFDRQFRKFEKRVKG